MTIPTNHFLPFYAIKQQQQQAAAKAPKTTLLLSVTSATSN